MRHHTTPSSSPTTASPVSSVISTSAVVTRSVCPWLDGNLIFLCSVSGFFVLRHELLVLEPHLCKQSFRLFNSCALALIFLPSVIQPLLTLESSLASWSSPASTTSSSLTSEAVSSLVRSSHFKVGVLLLEVAGMKLLHPSPDVTPASRDLEGASPLLVSSYKSGRWLSHAVRKRRRWRGERRQRGGSELILVTFIIPAANHQWLLRALARRL